jgi:hypothetical protein
MLARGNDSSVVMHHPLTILTPARDIARPRSATTRTKGGDQADFCELGRVFESLQQADATKSLSYVLDLWKIVW